MSAFLCSPKHIAAIVTWASRGHNGWKTLETTSDMDQAAELLARANIESIAYRYPDIKGKEAEEFLGMSREEYLSACKVPDIHSPIKPVQILKLISSLDYQSCEFPEWEESAARKLLDRVQGAAIAALPGYEQADWDI